MRKLVFAAVVAGILSVIAIAIVAAHDDHGSGLWPTSCVDLNDIVEEHLGNTHNVGIYQRTFGDGAEEACRNDHREDVRAVFAWAISTPAPEPPPAREPAPDSANARDWVYFYTTNDAIILSEAYGQEDKAGLIVRCYTGGERPEFFVYFYWYGTDIPELSDREVRRLELVYRFHDEEDAVAGWWDSWRDGDGATFMVLDENKRVAFARQTMTSPGLHVRFTKSGHSTDFYFGGHSHHEHPVITVMRQCGRYV